MSKSEFRRLAAQVPEIGEIKDKNLELITENARLRKERDEWMDIAENETMLVEANRELKHRTRERDEALEALRELKKLMAGEYTFCRKDDEDMSHADEAQLGYLEDLVIKALSTQKDGES